MSASPTLLILAAGMGSRYGGLKQVDPVGPNSETLMDYSVFDALRAGFTRIVFVIRRDFEDVFRATVAAKYAGQVDIDFAFQAMDDLPHGFVCPADRAKPWGTAHAIRAARDVVNTPFAAINADDFYGADAFAQLAAFLARPRVAAGGPLPFAMVGYRLDQTLSEHGTVSRGVCRTDAAGRLTGITEMTRIHATESGIVNQEADAPVQTLTGAERVSMNLWGFTPELFDLMATRFPAWLQANIDQPKSEWYIPFLVDDLVQAGMASVEVLPTDASWFGVTYKEDKPRVADAIARLVAAGIYPEKLR